MGEKGTEDHINTMDEVAVSDTSLPSLLELLLTPKKGFGLFATEDIKRGTRIIDEEPLITIAPHHSIAGLPDLLKKLTPEQYAQYTDLSSDQDKISSEEKTAFRDELKSKFHSGPALVAAVQDRVKVTSIFYNNSVEMGPHGRDGRGVFANCSRINHSCRPNVAVSYNQSLRKSTVHAIRDIQADEELTTAYIPITQAKDERLRDLQRTLGFVCRCEICSDDADPAAEERRHRLAHIMEDVAMYEQYNGVLSFFPMYQGPRTDAQALVLLEEAVGLLKIEGLVGSELVKAYHACSKHSLQVGHNAKAMAYARKMWEVQCVCSGDDDEEGMEPMRSWMKRVENMSEQEEVKDRMNKKREAKEQKKADKKAKKKEGKGKK